MSRRKKNKFFSPPWLELSYFGLLVDNVYDIEWRQIKLTKFDNISEVGSVITQNNNYNFSISLSHLYSFSLRYTWMFAYVSKKQWIMKVYILCSLSCVVNIVSLIFLLVFGWLMKLITKQAHALNLWPCFLFFKRNIITIGYFLVQWTPKAQQTKQRKN